MYVNAFLYMSICVSRINPLKQTGNYIPQDLSDVFIL
jgi:hypothetical protein